MPKKGYVYILASKRNGTLYVGATSNIVQRMEQHKAASVKGFTADYKINQLVYYEAFGNMSEAIAREKAVKKWNRAWKIRLIEAGNEEWNDLPVEQVLCK